MRVGLHSLFGRYKSTDQVFLALPHLVTTLILLTTSPALESFLAPWNSLSTIFANLASFFNIGLRKLTLSQLQITYVQLRSRSCGTLRFTDTVATRWHHLSGWQLCYLGWRRPRREGPPIPLAPVYCATMFVPPPVGACIMNLIVLSTRAECWAQHSIYWAGHTVYPARYIYGKYWAQYTIGLHNNKISLYWLPLHNK